MQIKNWYYKERKLGKYLLKGIAKNPKVRNPFFTCFVQSLLPQQLIRRRVIL